MNLNIGPEYGYTDAEPTYASNYLWPAVETQIRTLFPVKGLRAFDLGCGNGASAGKLVGMGFDVIGVDSSESGIAQAVAAHSRCRFEVGSAYDDLASRFGRFPLVISLEVVEHMFDPRRYARRLYDLVEPGGVAMVSTPYHGYLKNLALAVAGRMDRHFTGLWDGGHVKFFSVATLRELLREVGFAPVLIKRVGRVPPLAKSMLAIARRPR